MAIDALSLSSATAAAAALPFQGAEEAGTTDPFGVGLLLAIVGCFLLANSILFRHPRVLVAQYFGAEEKRLSSIRSYIFHRVQIHLGFLFLMLGFGLQLYGHFATGPVSASEGASGGPAAVSSGGFPTAWVGVLLLAVVALELGGWWLSHMLFRRYVRDFFRVHPPDLEGDMSLARELGELFRIPSEGDDSVQSYLHRIRHRIGIAPAPASGPSPSRAAGAPPPGTFGDAEAEEEFGLTS